ncbi:hypothetical protein [Planctomyces sp. SH-PL62]|uniref:hypothetical protein n=1 Tax=Planctomyces sp. SH-PL62 TaxID=1636152 RepID=UPI0018D3BD92|nr:hypothetical protein [Planctomyces sp. SH-PL62]
MTRSVQQEARLRRRADRRRADVYVSTLRRYVEAMGGKLSITAEFPDGPPVRVKQFGDWRREPDEGGPEPVGGAFSGRIRRFGSRGGR